VWLGCAKTPDLRPDDVVPSKAVPQAVVLSREAETAAQHHMHSLISAEIERLRSPVELKDDNGHQKEERDDFKDWDHRDKSFCVAWMQIEVRESAHS
jgi:hypothetical protein